MSSDEYRTTAETKRLHGHFYRAFARLTEDGRPIAASVRNAKEDDMVPVIIFLPETEYQWTVAYMEVGGVKEEPEHGCI